MSTAVAEVSSSAEDIELEGEHPEPSTSPSGSGPRGLVSLIVTPFVLIAFAVFLAMFVGGAEKDSAETSALSWNSKLLPQLKEHLTLTLWSTVLVILIAIPLGIALTRPILRRGGPESHKILGLVNPTVLSFANIGQALPAYGLFILFLGWLGQGERTSIIALAVFALLPVLLNTMVGLDQVDESVIEAGRGMGMSKMRVLTRIELPLAVPVILAGVRTALVINVGMATLAFFIGGGGLGITINSGLKLSRDLITFTGAAMAALVALTVDWIAAVVERVLRPKGI